LTLRTCGGTPGHSLRASTLQVNPGPGAEACRNSALPTSQAGIPVSSINSLSAGRTGLGGRCPGLGSEPAIPSIQVGLGCKGSSESEPRYLYHDRRLLRRASIRTARARKRAINTLACSAPRCFGLCRSDMIMELALHHDIIRVTWHRARPPRLRPPPVPVRTLTMSIQ
jgi:hypothetical protein